MIRACFHFEESTQKILGADISGHAGMDEYGYDIVCASVSSLVIAAINGLEEYVQTDVKAKVENGTTSFTIDEDDALKSTQAQAIVNTMYLAMLGLEDEYEDYIEVTITEE